MQSSSLQSGNLGLRAILASLVAISVVLVLTFRYQLAQDLDQVRAQGVNLARLLTKLPVSAEARSGWEQVLSYQLSNERFAYGSLASVRGGKLLEVAASGVVIPAAPAVRTGSWLHEAERETASGTIIEFSGPVRVGEEEGWFRIGLFKPGLALSLERLPFAASLMLPVFLLTPLFLFFVRREVTPLKAANAELQALLAEPDGKSAAMEPADLRGFAEQFNQFVDQAKAQLSAYEDEKSKLVTSERFLTYRMARLEVLLNSLPDGLLLTDADGQIGYANTRVKALLNLSPKALSGARLPDALEHPELISHFAAHGSNLGALVGEALIINPPHRADLSVSVSVHRLRTRASGESSGYLVVFRDATGEARARASQSEFVAHLAHELKAPLNTLSMYAEALQDDEVSSREFQLEATNVIKDEVERLARLISNLLSMTQIEMGTLSLDLHRIKLVELVRDAAETVARSARGRELTFELDLPHEVVPVRVDKDLLRIAINNLLTNAIKYTDPGGTITVSIEETDAAVTICVADTGIGISEEDQAQIFEKFYRASGEEMQNRQGHGLGLSLARDIVALHHGSLRVESKPGEGSRFYIDLWKRTGVMQEAI